ncbi:hypothetical protein FA95DRAFT_1449938, partial [Auriscalpium vulgare]
MDTREATSESHTAEWIVENIVNAIGPSRFSGLTCDSTGNTRASRSIAILALMPTALNLADVCHHLNRTILEINLITVFKPVIRVVRQTITLFHTSHAGHAALKKAREDLNTGRGLEAIGTTRFATIPLSARSVHRSLPAIKKVVSKSLKGTYEQGIAEYFQLSPDDIQTFKFESGLSQFIAATLPATKALACLEALEATAGDVYVFWHAVIRATEDALQNPRLYFDSEVANAIRGILNARHRQLFLDGNIANNAYIVAAYLNP